METKTCMTCGEAKALTEYYRHSRMPDGHHVHCKACHSKRVKNRRAENREEVNAKSRARYQRAKAAHRVWQTRWNEKNAEKIAAASKRSYLKRKDDPAFKARRAEALRRYQNDNRERENSKRRAKYRVNPAPIAAKVMRRSASQKKATPRWADHQAIMDVYAEAAYFSMQVDHIVPLQSNLVCGLHVWDNLQLLPKSHNCAKGNRHWPDMPGVS